MGYRQDTILTNLGSYRFNLGHTKVFTTDTIEYFVIKTMIGPQLVFPSEDFRWHWGTLHYSRSCLQEESYSSLDDNIKQGIYKIPGTILIGKPEIPKIRLEQLQRRHQIKPKEFEAIVESIKLSFSTKNTKKLLGGNQLDTDGHLLFSLQADYEIIGVFQKERRIKVLTKIDNIDCFEVIKDHALPTLKDQIYLDIIRKVPESLGLMDIVWFFQNERDII